MQKYAQEIQKNCSICKIEVTTKEAMLLVEVSDWWKYYVDYLTKEIFPESNVEDTKLKRHAIKYLEGHLYQKAYNGSILKCING